MGCNDDWSFNAQITHEVVNGGRRNTPGGSDTSTGTSDSDPAATSGMTLFLPEFPMKEYKMSAPEGSMAASEDSEVLEADGDTDPRLYAGDRGLHGTPDSDTDPRLYL